MHPNSWKFASLALLAFLLVYGLGKLLLPRVFALVNSWFGLNAKPESNQPSPQTLPENYFAVLVAVLCLTVVLLLALAGGVFVGLLVLIDYLQRQLG